MSFPTRRKILKSLLFGGTAIAAPSAVFGAIYGRGEADHTATNLRGKIFTFSQTIPPA